MWSVLLGQTSSGQDNAINSVLLTRSETSSNAILTTSVVLRLCLDVVRERNTDVVWIRHRDERHSCAPLKIYESDVAAHRRQAEIVGGGGQAKVETDDDIALQRIHIKYLDDYQDFKRYMVNAHLSEPRPSALVVDSMSVFCGKEADKVLEMAALMKELMSSCTSKDSFIAVGLMLDTRRPRASTARLAHLFEKRVELVIGEEGKSCSLACVPHSDSTEPANKAPIILVRTLSIDHNLSSVQADLVWTAEER